MEISLGSAIVAAGIGICYYIIISLSSRRKESLKSPPALPSLPLIGSLPFLGGLSSLHTTLTEKSKTYGNIFSLRCGSRLMVVLNGHEMIREALVQTPAEFAGRGVLYIEKYVWPDHGKGVVMRQPNDAQRKLRSSCLSVLKTLGFGSRAVMEQEIQEEVNHFLSYVRTRGEAPWYPTHYLEQFTNNVIYNLMFSKRFSYDGEEGQRMAIMINELFDSIDPIYDVFPIIAHFPPFRQRLVRYNKLYNEYLSFCEASVEESIRNADANETNFVKEYYKVDKEFLVNKREMAVLVRDLIVAGTETTSGQLSWAFLMLANRPDIQQRAHDELDTEVPRDRLPSLEDKGKLCYLEAIILEVFRLKTALPLALPHTTTEDVIVAGYHIPAGTELERGWIETNSRHHHPLTTSCKFGLNLETKVYDITCKEAIRQDIMVNLWSAHMDPQVFSEPEKFKPERFLNEDRQVINKELMIAFSCGRRSCLGEVLARQEMFLLLAAILQQFTLLPPEEEDKISEEAVLARTLVPVKYTIRFLPRE